MERVERKPVRRMKTDVGRRDRIAEAALTVIRKKGVPGLTHRAVAAVADVPLGSTTYHFATLEDILEAAFVLAMERDTARLEEWAATLTPESDIPSELATLVIEEADKESDTMHVNYELTLAAVHHTRLYSLADNWTMLMARLVTPYLGADAAQTASAVYEGLLFRQIVSHTPPERSALVEHFRRACGQQPSPDQ